MQQNLANSTRKNKSNSSYLLIFFRRIQPAARRVFVPGLQRNGREPAEAAHQSHHPGLGGCAAARHSLSAAVLKGNNI
jgi:hypothetical protein